MPNAVYYFDVDSHLSFVIFKSVFLLCCFDLNNGIQLSFFFRLYVQVFKKYSAN